MRELLSFVMFTLKKTNARVCRRKLFSTSSDFSKNILIFEDNHILVCLKPPSILSQSDKKGGEESLLDSARNYLSRNKTGVAYCGLVHRIDRPASGLIVFGKTSKASARLSEEFRERRVEKRYLAVVNGDIKKARETRSIDNFMYSNGIDRRSLVFEKAQMKEGSVPAKLEYEALFTYHRSGSSNNALQSPQSLLQVRLITGRKHQIRAQLSHEGSPIVGDVLYGAPQVFRSRDICLHAYRLAFAHPTLKTRMSFTAPPPAVWWERFHPELMDAAVAAIKKE